MKNIRTSAVVALALTGSLALAACTPPHENNSEQQGYLDTATTGPATPSIATTESADASAHDADHIESSEPSESTESTNPSQSTSATTAHESDVQEPVAGIAPAVEPAPVVAQ